MSAGILSSATVFWRDEPYIRKVTKPARLRIPPDGLSETILRDTLRNTYFSLTEMGGGDSRLLYIGAEAPWSVQEQILLFCPGLLPR